MTFSAAIPEKPNVMYIWSVMDELIEKFSDEISWMPPDSEKDAQAYDAIILAMNELKDYSLQMQELLWWWPPHMLRKAEIGKDAGLVFKNRFGEDRLPPLEGVKSMAYIRDIILPFMKYIADIDSEGWLIRLCEKVGVNFKEQIQIANAVADGMNRMLAHYYSRHIKREVSVTKIGHFAADVVVANDREQEETRENRPAP